MDSNHRNVEFGPKRLGHILKEKDFVPVKEHSLFPNTKPPSVPSTAATVSKKKKKSPKPRPHFADYSPRRELPGRPCIRVYEEVPRVLARDEFNVSYTKKFVDVKRSPPRRHVYEFMNSHETHYRNVKRDFLPAERSNYVSRTFYARDTVKDLLYQ